MPLKRWFQRTFSTRTFARENRIPVASATGPMPAASVRAGLHGGPLAECSPLDCPLRSTPEGCTCLGHVPAGRRVRVLIPSLDASSCARLRDLGVCEGRNLRVVRNDLVHGGKGNVILALGSGRVALPGELAQQVHVIDTTFASATDTDASQSTSPTADDADTQDA